MLVVGVVRERELAQVGCAPGSASKTSVAITVSVGTEISSSGGAGRGPVGQGLARRPQARGLAAERARADDA